MKKLSELKEDQELLLQDDEYEEYFHYTCVRDVKEKIAKGEYLRDIFIAIPSKITLDASEMLERQWEYDVEDELECAPSFDDHFTKEDMEKYKKY